jgi:sigma-E factor negative regulatory protein RseA
MSGRDGQIKDFPGPRGDPETIGTIVVEYTQISDGLFMANDNMKEEISALMDGETDAPQMQELIRELRNDPECRDCWEQYHLIGDALRNNLPSDIDRNLVSHISQAIANEDLPAPVKPAASQPEKPKRQAAASPWTGFALAASVAAVAYLGVGMITQEEPGTVPRVATSAPAQVAPLARTTPPPSDFRTVQGHQWTVTRPAVESRLNNYLLSHRNVAGSTAMSPAVLPNARLVVSSPRGGE